ncbi:F-box/kelch-repeat protein At1g57790-like [Macadamia integrifolia]|uniref:F-box/kelch-repeat protein At1g57790-like n=1 Tax=Macadamia integrifolia TaxID=60698 RepID=UPI001C4EC62C|nr:F-box/kelch-repeat protein At1g57790-like [Macadamia integrifolia]
MTGRKRTAKRENPGRVDELRLWSDLPTVLLQFIVSNLCLEDHVRLSCVCKEWRNVSRPLRVVNQSPWLLFSPAADGIIKFFDPLLGKFYFDEIPELKGTVIHCSKDGWVLFSGNDNSIFLFDLFSKSIIDLPCCSIFPFSSAKVAISCEPTVPLTVVFAIRTEIHGRWVFICICHPGDTQWTTFDYQNSDDALFRCVDGPVFLPPHNRPRWSFGLQKDKHIVQFKGELLLVLASFPNKPIINKLDLTKMKWVEMESLNGITVFVSSHSSLSVTDVPIISRNSVYFTGPYKGNSSYLYSLDKYRYHSAMQWPKTPSSLSAEQLRKVPSSPKEHCKRFLKLSNSLLKYSRVYLEGIVNKVQLFVVHAMLYRVRVDELRPWSELPTELLELIVSCLRIEDNVRLSCVCKKW